MRALLALLAVYSAAVLIAYATQPIPGSYFMRCRLWWMALCDFFSGVSGPVVVVVVILVALVIGCLGFDAMEAHRYRRFGP